jgi:hypothetical protein
METLYWGPTQSISGASYLNTKAVLDVEEGYWNGSSMVYTTLGTYEVEDFQDMGSLDRRINLKASSPLSRLKSNTLVTNRTIKSTRVFWDNVDGTYDFDANYESTASSGTWGASVGNYIYCQDPSANSSLAYTELDDIENGRILCKLETDDTSTNNSGVIIRASSGDDENNMSGYYVALMWDSNVIRIMRYDNGSVTTLESSSSVTLNSGTEYYLLVTFYGGEIYAAVYDDPTSSELAEARTTDDTYTSGQIGLLTQGAGTQVNKWFYFQFAEITNQNARESVLEDIWYMGNNTGVTFQQDYYGWDDFNASTTGACWDVSNDTVTYYADGNSNLIESYILGETVSDFVAEVQVRGGVTNIGAIGVGTTTIMYGSWLRYSDIATGLQVQLDGNNMIGYYSGEWVDYIEPGASTWYDLKLVKRGSYVASYINNTLYSYWEGLSWEDVNAVHPMVFGYQGHGQQGLEFRNFRINALDDLVEDVEITAGQPLKETWDRYFPDGYAAINGEDCTEVFRIGASRETHTLSSETDYFTSTTRSISNVASADASISRSTDATGAAQSGSDRIDTQADSTRVDFTSDPNIVNTTEADNHAERRTRFLNREVESININMVSDPTYQLYDFVDFVDTTIGVSGQYIVWDINKNYNSSEGRIDMNLTLVPWEYD